VRNDGWRASVLLEWRASAPAGLDAYVAEVVENILTDEDVKRPEEIRTLKIGGTFKEDPRIDLAYQCSQQPVNLRDVLLKMKNLSLTERACIFPSSASFWGINSGRKV
jgi:hypothetical protein